MTHVLVADDDEEIRLTLRTLLEDAGHAVTEAENGATALAILESSERPLVALLDYRMPEINGTGVLAALADPEGRLRTRHAVVLLTAANARDLRSAVSGLFEGEPVSVVAKPFDVETVLRAVEEAAERIGEADGAA